MALSDPGAVLASPLTIIERTEESSDFDSIIAIVSENEVGRIIAGLPLSMDGSTGPQAEKAKAFAAGLAAKTDVPLEFRDERLSTVTARNLMQSSRKKKKDRKKQRDDAFAAAVILQGYLDEHLENKFEELNEFD